MVHISTDHVRGRSRFDSAGRARADLGSRPHAPLGRGRAHRPLAAGRRLLAGRHRLRGRLPRDADPVPRLDCRRPRRVASDERRGGADGGGRHARRRRVGRRGHLGARAVRVTAPRDGYSASASGGAAASSMSSFRSTKRRPTSVARITTIETTNTITATAITCGRRLGNRSCENR